MNASYVQALKLNIRDLMNVSATDASGEAGMCLGGMGPPSPCLIGDSVPLMFSYLAWMGTELPFYWDQGLYTRPKYGGFGDTTAASITTV